MSPSAPKAKLAQRLLSGSIWMIAARWAMRLIGLVSTMILARLLAPEDFGLIAMVMIAYGLFETISYAGVDLALMRGATESREHFDTAWTIQIIQGVFVAVCVVAVSPWAASYFNEPRVVAVMWAVAPKALIDGLQNIGVVWFRKDLDFAKEFRFTLYSKLIGFVFVVGAAVWLRDYWALVIGSLAASVATVAASYLMHPYRPRLSLARVAQLWSFSQWLMISRFGSFLNRKVDAFVVGGAVGTAAMGSYHVAGELATLPSTELVMPIRRALFPSLAKIADDRAGFARTATESFSAVAVLCLFVSLAMWAVAPEFVAVVLGAKWADAVPLVQLLAIFGGASALVLVLEVPLWVAGKTNLSALQAWLELAVLVPVLYWAVQAGGAEGAAAARAGVAVAMVPVMMALAVRAGNISWVDLFGSMWRPLAASVLVAWLVSILPWATLPHPLLALSAKLLFCGAAFVLALTSMWLISGRPAGFEATTLMALRRVGRRA